MMESIGFWFSGLFFEFKCLDLIIINLKKSIMKKLLPVFAFAILLASCSAPKFEYKYKLIKPILSDQLSYTDSKLDLTLNVKDSYVDLKIKNLSDRPLKIIWDDASFVKLGEAQKIIHKNVKFIDKEKTQSPTVIPVNSFVTEMIQPIDNISFETVSYGSYGKSSFWSSKPLFLKYNGMSSPKYVEKKIKPLLGSKIAIYLPIEYDGKNIEYLFELEITDVLLLNGKKSTSLIN